MKLWILWRVTTWQLRPACSRLRNFLLHQESGSNNKAEYIMGHSCQVVSLLAAAKKSCFAIPLVSRIHEGVVFSNKLLEPWALMPIIFGWKICSQLKGVPAINMFTKEALNTEMQFAENLQPITDIYRPALLHRGFCNIFLLHSHCLFGIPSDHGCELLCREFALQNKWLPLQWEIAFLKS